MKIRLYQKIFGVLALTLLAFGCSNQAPVADKSPNSQQSPSASETASVAPQLAQSWQLINFGAPW